MLKKITAAILRPWRIARLEKLECDLDTLRANISMWQQDPAHHHLLGTARLGEAHLVREVQRLTEAVK